MHSFSCYTSILLLSALQKFPDIDTVITQFYLNCPKFLKSDFTPHALVPYVPALPLYVLTDLKNGNFYNTNAKIDKRLKVAAQEIQNLCKPHICAVMLLAVRCQRTFQWGERVAEEIYRQASKSPRIIR